MQALQFKKINQAEARECLEGFADKSITVQELVQRCLDKGTLATWGAMVMTIEPFLERYRPGTFLHMQAAVLGIRAAIDFTVIPENLAIEIDIGHHLGKAGGRLCNESLFQRHPYSEGLKLVLEFLGQQYEANGRFDRAVSFYLASYPEKYQDKFKNCDRESGTFRAPYFKKRSQTIEQQRQAFLGLIAKIRDDTLMNGKRQRTRNNQRRSASQAKRFNCKSSNSKQLFK